MIKDHSHYKTSDKKQDNIHFTMINRISCTIKLPIFETNRISNAIIILKKVSTHWFKIFLCKSFLSKSSKSLQNKRLTIKNKTNKLKKYICFLYKNIRTKNIAFKFFKVV